MTPIRSMDDSIESTPASLLLNTCNMETQTPPEIVLVTGAADTGITMPLAEDPFIKLWMNNFSDDHYALEISRAEQWLNWRPEHSLTETLPKMVRALKRDPVAWYREHDLSLPADLERHP